MEERPQRKSEGNHAKQPHLQGPHHVGAAPPLAGASAPTHPVGGHPTGTKYL